MDFGNGSLIILFTKKTIILKPRVTTQPLSYESQRDGYW